MEKPKYFCFVVIAVSISLVFSTCETWRHECEGWIIVENPIPDTTLHVGGESFERDLLASPVVLNHTDDQEISIILLAEDGTIVDANRIVSQTTGKLNAIKITPLKVGETDIRLISDTDCQYFEMSFHVSVIDSTNN